MVSRQLRTAALRAALLAALAATACSGLTRGGLKDVAGADGGGTPDGAGGADGAREDAGPDAAADAAAAPDAAADAAGPDVAPDVAPDAPGPDADAADACAADCDDGDPCTRDRCDGATGACVHEADLGADGTACDDEDRCTLTSACSGGLCEGTLAIECDDRQDCTADDCEPETGCVFTPRIGACTPPNQDCATGTCEDGACVLTMENDTQCLLGGGCVPEGSRPPTGAHADCITCDPDADPFGLSPDTGLLGQLCDSNPCRTGPAGQMLCTADGECGGALSEPANEGGACDFGHPAITEAECAQGDCRPVCGGTVCPALDGYEVRCNEDGGCQYAVPGFVIPDRWDVWIWVPPGSFAMGGPPEEPGNPAEGPVHTVTFTEGFFIARWPIVVQQYERCVAAGVCPPASVADDDAAGWGPNGAANGRLDHPQNGLDRDDAAAFCAWIVAGEGGRLPSEAEWEYAATGPTHRVWPWGDTPAPDCNRATFDDSAGADDAEGARPWGCATCTASGCSGTAPVDAYADGASPFGVESLAGNVHEWTADCWHGNYDGAPADGAAWTTGCTAADGVTRGGSFASPAEEIRSASRAALGPSVHSALGGARCVR